MIKARELKKVCLQFRNGLIGKDDPHSKCYMVSIALSDYLDALGIKNEIVRYEIDISKFKHVEYYRAIPVETVIHYCLKIGNKILDPTADQLKEMPKIFYGSRPIYYKQYVELTNPN